MRAFIFLIAFLLPAILLGNPSFKLYVTNCKTDEVDKPYTIAIYKNEILFDKITFKGGTLDTTFRNVDFGVYKFEFLSVFNETISDSLVITRDSSYWKGLCIDEFKNSSGKYKGFIDSLQNDSFYTIQYDAYGCFHWETQTMKIFMRSNQLFCTLYGTEQKRQQRKTHLRPVTILLTTEKLNDVLNFQVDLYSNATGSSASTEMTFYTFQFGKTIQKFTDDEKGRKRFLYMRKRLFEK